MLQLHRLSPQPNIDRRHDLLDGAETICLMRPSVPWEVEQLVTGQKTPRTSVDDLFIGREGWLWPATGIVEQDFDCRAINNIQSDDIAAAVAPYLKRGRVEHKDVFKRFA